MVNIKEVIATILMGITEEGMKVLKNNRDIAIELIDGCIEECENSISKAKTLDKSNVCAIYEFVHKRIESY
ncbi:hypothetical protein BAMA_10560 [Bacillus manliponensis]|uniref:Uncharacterized protein n=1 Tax=Bacillus manliponensis TaxID=574376 RepID=A0A073JUH0_9BACI|nr:hypothetical protein [Bacillus manliponensis]KEK17915.1 hypothetical protein BAMA_10560 [Bacillus manliponensis]